MEIRVRNVPPTLHTEMKVLAARQQTTLNDLVLAILEEYVKKQAGKK